MGRIATSCAIYDASAEARSFDEIDEIRYNPGDSEGKVTDVVSESLGGLPLLLRNLIFRISLVLGIPKK